MVVKAEMKVLFVILLCGITGHFCSSHYVNEVDDAPKQAIRQKDSIQPSGSKIRIPTSFLPILMHKDETTIKPTNTVPKGKKKTRLVPQAFLAYHAVEAIFAENSEKAEQANVAAKAKVAQFAVNAKFAMYAVHAKHVLSTGLLSKLKKISLRQKKANKRHQKSKGRRGRNKNEKVKQFMKSKGKLEEQDETLIEEGPGAMLFKKSFDKKSKNRHMVRNAAIAMYAKKADHSHFAQTAGESVNAENAGEAMFAITATNAEYARYIISADGKNKKKRKDRMKKGDKKTKKAPVSKDKNKKKHPKKASREEVENSRRAGKSNDNMELIASENTYIY